jgi:hypothetical protein
MKRHTGQKALYEAWSGSRSKHKRLSLLDRLKPQLEKLRKPSTDQPPGRPTVEVPPPPTLKPPKPVVKRGKAPPAPNRVEPAEPWMRSRPIQFNAGRIEVSISYQLGIAVGLGLILLLLLMFKVGQMDQRSRSVAASTAERSSNDTPETTPGSAAGTPTPPPAATRAELDSRRTVAASAGDHWIVLTSYSRQADLEAAKLHFANHGIATEIFAVSEVRRVFIENGLNADVLPSGDDFMLVTDPREGLFDNPQREGTDGYAMRQRIREVGAQYDPVGGLKSFDFSDVYGMKVN